MPGTMVARGNVMASFVIYAALTPVAVAANSTVEQSFTIPGLQSNDQVSAMSLTGAYTVNVDVTNIRVSAPNTMTVAYTNGTGAPVTPTAGNYVIEINRLEAARYADLPANCG